jgi:hypothetical protein
VRFYPAAVILAIPLCGFGSCSQKPERPTMPKMVTVTVEKLVPVDERLTKPCPTKRAVSRTVEAVVAAYNQNIATLEDCDTRMSEIRALGGE